MKIALPIFKLFAVVLFFGMILPMDIHAMNDKQLGLPAPENATAEQVGSDVKRWLTFVDLLDAARLVNPAGYGDCAYPAIQEILDNPSKFQGSFDDPARAHFAIRRALELVAVIGSPNPELATTVKSYLFDDDAATRGQAVRALSSIGGPGDIPALVVMLYDPDSMVRHQAVTALGKLGDESALVVLDIWEKQATVADESRPATKKWIDRAMPNRLKEARQAIQARQDTSEQ